MPSVPVEVELRKGDSLVSPFDPRLKISWGRFRGLVFVDKPVLFKPQAYSVEAVTTDGRKTTSVVALPYDVWVDSNKVIGIPGFSLLLRQSSRGSSPTIFIRWISVQESASFDPSPERHLSAQSRPRVPRIPRERPNGEFKCASCREHRRPHSLVDVLLADIGRYAGTGTTALRNRLLEEETNIAAELEDELAELESAVMPDQPQDISWSRRPTTHAYCGLDEGASAWYFEKAKNPNGECEDMRPPESVKGLRSCGTCAHNVTAPDTLVAAIQDCLASVGPQASKLIDDFDREVASRAEYEVTAAFRGVGSLSNEPKLLPHCRTFSSEVSYVIGPCVNPLDRCRKWEDDEGVKRSTEGSFAAMEAWGGVVKEREVMSQREAAVDQSAIGNIWAISTSALGAVLNSTSYDNSRVQFLALALPVVGVPAGKATVIVAQADRALHDERRMPYTPPIPRSYG